MEGAHRWPSGGETTEDAASLSSGEALGPLVGGELTKTQTASQDGADEQMQIIDQASFESQMDDYIIDSARPNRHGYNEFVRLRSANPSLAASTKRSASSIKNRGRGQAGHDAGWKRSASLGSSVEPTTDLGSSESEGSSGEVEDLAAEMYKHIECFYDQNYFNYDVCSFKEYNYEKIWSVLYDDNHDYVYLTLAKI